MKKQIIILLFTASLTACNHNENSSTTTDHADHSHHMDDRTTQMMAIHDSLMPAMGKLMELKKQIDTDMKQTDSLLAIKPDVTLKERRKHALDLNLQLENADQQMMDWMHQYKGDTLQKLDHQAATQYISDQTRKIMQVREVMIKSMSDAQYFLRHTSTP